MLRLIFSFRDSKELKYSNNSNSRHSNTGNIQKPDTFEPSFLIAQNKQNQDNRVLFLNGVAKT